MLYSLTTDKIFLTLLSTIKTSNMKNKSQNVYHSLRIITDKSLIFTVNVQKLQTLLAYQKNPRQTVQTQIRLLLKHYDLGLPLMLFWQVLCHFQH